MRLLRNTTTTFFLFLLVTLTACVTINVYFPAAQAEKAAEKIVDEILGEPQKQQPKDNADKGAMLWRDMPYRLIVSISHVLISDARAGQPDFSVNTPEIRRLQSDMASRNGQLTPYYNSGAIGFDRNGMVAIHDQGALSIKQRGAVNSLITAENRDRTALYKAIAKANGHPEWENDVRAIFAKKWAQKARSGWWYQAPGGSWAQK